MPCKPVDQAHPAGRPAMWAAMRKKDLFTVPQVAAAVDRPKRTVASYVSCLLASGHVAVAATVISRRGAVVRQYRITDAGRQVAGDAPRVRRDGQPVTKGRAQQQLWTAMRHLGGTFTADELAWTASTVDVAVSPVHATDYCRTLALAGYLRAQKGAAAVWYAFLPHRDTGPRAPQIQRTTRVWDANLRLVVWPAIDQAPGGGE